MTETPLYKSTSKAIMADAYNVSLHTFRKWTTPIKAHLGDYVGRAYTPKQVALIVELLGEPENITLIRV